MKPIDLFGGAKRGRIVLPLGEPLTLGNMRANGVRSLDVLPSPGDPKRRPWPDDVPVPAFGPSLADASFRLGLGMGLRLAHCRATRRYPAAMSPPPDRLNGSHAPPRPMIAAVRRQVRETGLSCRSE
jgi:hypothetical protein